MAVIWCRRDFSAMTLSDAASIVLGVSFRERVENIPDGKILVVQPRDICGNGDVAIESTARISQLSCPSELFLQKGDVLLQPRGTSISLGVVRDLPGTAVAAAPILILRCTQSLLDPEFLAQYLLMTSVQAQLRSSAAGTYSLQIPRSAIEGLPIELPPLSSQRKLVELASMERLEADLSSRLVQKRGQLFELAVRQLSLKDRGRKTAAGPHSDSAGARTPAES